MIHFPKLTTAARKLSLGALKFVLKSRRLFNGFDEFQLSKNSGRIVVYFAQDLVTLSFEAKTTTLNFGRAHAFIIELPAIEDTLGLSETVVLRCAPETVPVERIEAPTASIRGSLLRLLFILSVEFSSILEVKRTIKIIHSNGGFEPVSPIPVTKPGDWPEKYTRSVRSHLAYVLDLTSQRQSADIFNFQIPLISFIVPVFNAKPEHLEALLRSFYLQPTSVAELILSDDKSTSMETIEWLDAHIGAEAVTIIRNDTQSGISGATNSGLRVARGDWVSFIDHDDALLPFSVGEIARAIIDNPNCAFMYTDEVITDENLEPQAYFLKPAWDPILLSGVNYINHLSLYKREIVETCGVLRSEFDGSQDYDLLLRYTALIERSQVKHLPFPAYLWRRSETTYSARFMERATQNARNALSERFSKDKHLEVVGAVDPNLHRIRFDVAQRSWPKISVIIPSRDAPELIDSILTGLFEKTDYPALEVIVIDNGTTNQITLDIYKIFEAKSDFTVIIEPAEFNFSAAVNKGIRHSTSDFVLLLNNDIEISSADWLKEMISCFDYEDVGIVGSKLLYPNGALQHAGVIAGLGQLAGHWFIGNEANFPGPMGRLWVRQTFSCVTGAAMLISRKCIDTVGWFDEVNFAVAYNDVDFCLRATQAGFRVAWTPFAQLIHHESASRGSDVAPDKVDRFRREQSNLKRIHRTDLYEDPAYNPWYSRMHSSPAFLLRRDLPTAR